LPVVEKLNVWVVGDWFVTVTVCGALVLPTAVALKTSVIGETAMGNSPVPVSGTSR
jgi:hypothetical protein